MNQLLDIKKKRPHLAGRKHLYGPNVSVSVDVETERVVVVTDN